MELIISQAKGKKGKRYKGKDPLPFVYSPSHRYGVPGYPIAIDAEGNSDNGIPPEIRRMSLGAAK
jgi:hypothetical protein